MAMNPIKAGKKAAINRPKAAGIRAYREAQLLDTIIPGLPEKFTGPITPISPERILPRPVTDNPRVILAPYQAV